jgi:hypothetical protein
VPPIESSPSPLEVAPPEGFELEDETVGVFGIDCGINDASCSRPKPKKPVIPKTVGDKSATDDPENNPNVDGGDKDREPTPTEQAEIDDLSNQIKGGVDSTKIEDFITLTLDFAKVANGGVLDPAQTIAVLTQMQQQISEGVINSLLVDDVVATLQAGKVQELAASGQDLRAGISLASDPNQATMAGSFLLRYRVFGALSLFLSTGGNPTGERQFFTNLYFTVMTGVVLASRKDEAKTNPQVVPGTVDFAGSPDPEDLCKDKDPNLPTAGDLRKWAEGQGYTSQGKGVSGIETWANSTGDWVLKLKPPSVWDTINPESKVFRYSVRTLDGSGDYIDPMTGQRGIRKEVGHPPFDPCDF